MFSLLSRQNRTRLAIIFVLLIATLLTVVTTKQILAQDRSVGLTSFTAEPLVDGRVQLNWLTGFENSTSHFVILRTISGTVPGYPADTITVSLNATPVTIVPAIGSGGGATYTVFDEDTVAGQAYRYVIVDFESSGSFAVHNAPTDEVVTAIIGDIAQAGLSVSPNPSFAITGDGVPVTHTLTITNTGNRNEFIIATAIQKEWSTTLSWFNQPLAPGESASLDIRVTGDNTTGMCASDTALIKFTVTEVFSSTFETTTEVTTQLGCIFLPSIQK